MGSRSSSSNSSATSTQATQTSSEDNSVDNSIGVIDSSQNFDSSNRSTSNSGNSTVNSGDSRTFTDNSSTVDARDFSATTIDNSFSGFIDNSVTNTSIDGDVAGAAINASSNALEQIAAAFAAEGDRRTADLAFIGDLSAGFASNLQGFVTQNAVDNAGLVESFIAGDATGAFSGDNGITAQADGSGGNNMLIIAAVGVGLAATLVALR